MCDRETVRLRGVWKSQSLYPIGCVMDAADLTKPSGMMNRCRCSRQGSIMLMTVSQAALSRVPQLFVLFSLRQEVLEECRGRIL